MRLFILYSAIWVPALSYKYWTTIVFPVEVVNFAYFYMFALIAVLLYFSVLFRILSRSQAAPSKIRALLSEIVVNRYMKQLAIAWSCIYFIEIVMSGGLPIIWTDSRDYKDFGIPVVHGLSNSIRGLNFGLLITFILLNIKIRLSTRLIIYFSIFSALILEQSRGAFFVSVSFAAGAMLLYFDFNIKTIFKSLIVLTLLVLIFPVIQISRYSETPFLTIVSFYQKFAQLQDIRTPLIPLENYIITPVINASLNIEAAPIISFQPYFTIKPLIPSFLRNLMFEGKNYGLIFNEAFNTTSFITPFVRDFGFLGSFLILTVYFFLCSYIYARARQGSLMHIFQLGPVCMTLIMSFFTSYVTSLVFVFAIILSSYMARIMLLSSRKQYQSAAGIYLR